MLEDAGLGAGSFGAMPFAAGEPEAIAVLPEIADHCDRGIRRLALQYRDKVGLADLLCALIDPLQELELELAKLGALRHLGTATGAQLTGLAERVGELRNGLDDSALRVRVRARIIANACTGDAETVRDVLEMLIGGHAPVIIEQAYPGAMILRTNGISVRDGEDGARLARVGTCAGMRTLIEYDLPDVISLGFDDDNSAGELAEFGADPTPAGYFAEATDAGQNEV